MTDVGNLVSGAPALAPLLLADVMLLALLGLWTLEEFVPAETVARRESTFKALSPS